MKLFIKVYDNDGNIVAMPFDTDDAVPLGGSYQLAETKAEYLSRTKVSMRNYRARAVSRLQGSVLTYRS